MSESMMCCPLSSDGDGEGECVDNAVVRARKDYVCCECDDPITKGTEHERYKMLWEGSFSTSRTCLSCVEIRDHFACNGRWIFGCLWGDLEENFFPEMKMGGPCMQGLSPEAKARLVAARMEWYFTQDEVPDQQWDHWVKRSDRTKPPPGLFRPLLPERVDLNEQRARDGLPELTTYELRRAELKRGNPAGNGW